MTKTITAIFESRQEMEDALRRLEAINITNEQIGVVMSDEMRGKSFKLENHDKADEGLAAGATFGGIVGGVLAAVLSVGSLTIPGLNLVIAGSVVSGLAGAGLGAAAGGLVGGLIGLGITEHEAKIYEGKLKAGNILLAIDAKDNDQAQEIRKILENTRAYDIAA